jgi:predicted O-methyltransferase YrrM
MLEQLNKLAVKWREQKIPILNEAEAEWLTKFIQKEQPKKILELGTAVGFSGTILGHLGAQLHTIDSDGRSLEVAYKTFEEFNIDATVYEGDAIDVLEELLLAKQDEFDLIFMDHQKKQYAEVLEMCVKLLKPNGILLTDDVLMDKASDFYKQMQKDDRFTSELINLGDGLLISRKKE